MRLLYSTDTFMGIRWQYLAEGDRYRWYRLVSRENQDAIEEDMTTLEKLNVRGRGIPVLAPWRIVGVLIDKAKLRASLRRHLAKFDAFHRDVMANTDYPRLAGEEETGNYSEYPEYQNWLKLKRQAEGVMAGKIRRPQPEQTPPK